jgi:hypothetical protein
MGIAYKALSQVERDSCQNELNPLPASGDSRLVKRRHLRNRRFVGTPEGASMSCLICRYLENVLESRRSEYIEVRSSACYRVCTKPAAFMNVDMERAKEELEEHKSLCASAARELVLVPATALLRITPEIALRGYLHR